ncbi:MAG: CobW/HypB/UreG, nucleotide-binding domain-containing protein [Monoraphidium minutum]|nr:MAG: CobW/HypB/UreG, nucleotide-binding domain-containing protein [Monoraphidium minutum]
MPRKSARELGEDAIVLSSRYEQRLLQPHGDSGGARAVPAVVITGFLGSGKTTLVAHLLEAAGGSLKLGVLVNEVGDVDIDSALVNARQRNAAVGVRAADLSGGCACCAVAGAFGDALAELAGGSAYHDLDYLLVETSGAADASSLAAALGGGGFVLDLVVCVMDGEAGAALLAAGKAEEAAAGPGASLRTADVVVINKADLATLGMAADLEDAVRRLAPSARLMRARFGRVPVEALLDAAAPGGGGQDQPEAAGGGQQGQQREGGAEDAAAAGGGGDGGGGRAAASVVGEVGFLSHEGFALPRHHAAAGPAAHAAGGRRRPRAAVAAAGGCGHGAAGAHGAPAASAAAAARHSAFDTLSVVVDESPLCMACFQRWVVAALLPAPGLCRAKGIVWLAQCRGRRHVFHVSGRQRAECGAQPGGWQGPPGTRLVLIAQQGPAGGGGGGGGGESGAGAPRGGGGGGPGREGLRAAAAPGGAAGLEALRRSLLEGCVAGSCGCGRGGGGSPHGSAAPAGAAVGDGCGGGDSEPPFAGADAFRALVEAHPRFRLLPPAAPGGMCGGEGGGAAAVADARAAAEAARGVVEFSAEAAPLHGVDAELVNAQVLRLANAAAAGAAAPGARFLCAAAGAASLCARTGLVGAERPVASLQAAFSPWEGSAAGAAAWAAVAGEAGAAGALRRAYAHVTSCRCDVASEAAPARR